MCGIVGYIGKNYSRKHVLEGLERLEYRGYDSAGFACLNAYDNRLLFVRSAGQLSNLIQKIEAHPIDGTIGMGHTRWSTHGVSSQENAHPQLDCHNNISIIHNGIVENHHQLRIQLEDEGHIFSSQTDTEIIAHLLESLMADNTPLKSAIIDVMARIEGAYAFISIMQAIADTMIVVRKRSPLCIGKGDNEMYIASDLLAFSDKTKKIFFMPDYSFAFVKQQSIELYDACGNPLPVEWQEISVDYLAHEKKGHEHYMLKEIYEQKHAICQTISVLNSVSSSIWSHMGTTADHIKQLDSLNMIGCGTSWHAARIAQFFFETICMMRTSVLLGSEFRYMSFFPANNSLYMTISQSGETADTLEALRLITSLSLPTVALTNVVSSTMVREADGFLLTQAGQEIAVASTKAFSTQVAALFWLANRMALEKGIINQQQMMAAQEDILLVAQVLEDCIERYKFEIIQTHALKYSQYKQCIFLGRHISYPFALEAALKLKEVAYIFAQCYPAGELKHGPLALVDAQTPVFLFSHNDPVIYKKVLSNAQEVKARNGQLVVFAFEGQTELAQLADLLFVIPHVNPLLGPLAMTGLMQFFVYQIALQLGCSIDKPRNLAKSVTVE